MKLFISLLFSLLAALPLAAQDKSTLTATLVVKGNCEECKKRIENAADIKGVKFSEWNEEKQTITVTYRPDKVTLEEIEKAIAASGHDTQHVKSEGQAYKKLPACCRYRDKKCETNKQ